jgi:hypothetical protein
MFLKVLGSIVALSLIACVYLVLRKHAALKRAEQFDGVVVEHVARRGSKGGRTYALAIEFRDHRGTPSRLVTSTSSNPASREIGEHVVVFKHSEGGRPEVLIFQELYLFYWIWFCLALCVAGTFAAPRVLDWLYLP